jgi:hypothetical protein
MLSKKSVVGGFWLFCVGCCAALLSQRLAGGRRSSLRAYAVASSGGGASPFRSKKRRRENGEAEGGLRADSVFAAKRTPIPAWLREASLRPPRALSGDPE